MRISDWSSDVCSSDLAGGTKVEIEETGGGWYAITAPWLDDAEKVQGRDAAETRQREIHAAGEPDNYKGVTLTAGENGWYVITRDGSETELKVHGEEQARADADRKSTRLNSSHQCASRLPSSD